MPLIKKIAFLEHELQEARKAGEFVNQMLPIKGICKAETSHGLMTAVTKAFRYIMGVKKVDFYFINQEVIQMMTDQGVRFTHLRVQT
jgi:hypothetical protein